MDDDDVLGAMRQTLTEVRMDRPLDAIVRRGRARRRKRVRYGVAAGGLAVGFALALVLPLITQLAPAAPTNASGSPEVVPAPWTVERLPDKRVKLTVRVAQIADPAGLQRALAGAGVSATLMDDPFCEVVGNRLPQAAEVFRQERPADGDWVSTITPEAMPPGSRLVLTILPGKSPLLRVQLVAAPNRLICVARSPGTPGS